VLVAGASLQAIQARINSDRFSTALIAPGRWCNSAAAQPNSFSSAGNALLSGQSGWFMAAGSGSAAETASVAGSEAMFGNVYSSALVVLSLTPPPASAGFNNETSPYYCHC
jgi:hypothetical protein